MKISSFWRGWPAEFADIKFALFRNYSAAEWRLRAITIVLPVLFLAAVLAQPWFNKRAMFMDTITAAQFTEPCCSVSFGFVSTTGIIIWVATSAICLFSALLLHKARASFDQTRFLLMAGVFTGWLALDDAFLMHERILPAAGINQNAILAFYVVFAAAYFAINRRQILKFDIWLLIMGAGGFALSIFVDAAVESRAPVFLYLEDSAKFFAICCWFSFHTASCMQLVNRTIDRD